MHFMYLIVNFRIGYIEEDKTVGLILALPKIR
jgi:hypothetical protein